MTELLERALQPSLKMESKSIKGPHELLGMETALLIATAASREIDVSVWFGERASDGKLPVREFDAKIMSLASAMGINQDLETKRELELATSTLALRMVHTVCAAGEDAYGQLLIDVSYFFKLSQEKVDKYLSEIDAMEGEEEQDHYHQVEEDTTHHQSQTNNFREWKDGAYDINGNLIPDTTLNNGDAQNRYEDYDAVQLSAEDYISDLKSKANDPRPRSAPVGGRATSRGETVMESMTPSNEPIQMNSPSLKVAMTNSMKWSEAKMTPSSPYDEEIEFQEEDQHYDSDSDYGPNRGSAQQQKSNNVKKDSLSQKQASENVDWNAENRAFLQLTSGMPSKSEVATKPRPSSAPRMGRSNVKTDDQPIRTRSAERRSSTELQQSNASKPRSSVNGYLGVRKSSQEQKLPLTNQQLEHLKEIVEDLARDTVKKTDSYHLIQVNLGYIESYTMIPPRGVIVQSKHREWITNRELHCAFIAGRLFLNDNQIKALKQLVLDFSKQYRKLREKADQLIKLSDELEEKLPGHVFGPSHTLSSEWLKKYLLHLRLSKKAPDASAATLKALNTSSIASKPPTLDPSDSTTKTPEEANTQEEIDAAKTPMMWKEWLGKKLKQEIERGPVKPKDFQKALNGQNHPLSKEDVEYLLKSHHILPQEALQQEIEYRIESWVLDTDGRRDFQHQLNVKIRNWIWEEMIKTKSAKMPKDETGYWRLWQRLEKERRSEVKEAIIKKLVDEKREELKSLERTRNEVTKNLYWQFDAARKERELPWTEWLLSHLDKFRRNLDKFKKDEEERLKIANKQKQRRKSMASLQAIESNLKEVGKSLNAHHQMQLQKGIVNLRRAAQENGLGKGGIVTKEEFDAHIRQILAPYIPLDETFVENHAMDKNAERAGLTRFAEEWRTRIQNLFTPDPKETLQRVDQDKDKQSNKSKVSYQTWLSDKNKAKQNLERKEMEEKMRTENDEESRRKKSEKAFKKWLKLRKQNKYKSRVDNKYHPVPVVKPADHSGRWNYEKELPNRDNEDYEQPARVHFTNSR